MMNIINQKNVLIFKYYHDGKPIERLRHFSIEVDPKGFEPEYTVKQYMDFPDNEEYCF